MADDLKDVIRENAEGPESAEVDAEVRRILHSRSRYTEHHKRCKAIC